MFIPVIDTLVDIADKTFTGDALLTQRKLAHYCRRPAGPLCIYRLAKPIRLRRTAKTLFKF